MSSGTSPTLGHRPALDGLRGIAVLLVIVGHTVGVSGHGHRGSAMGVTLFFVLSGFLITTLLLEEHGRTGRISLRGFYARRARRLLPAAALVLAFVTAVQWSTGLLDQWWRSVGATAFYVANLTKAADISTAPLGHAWSLAMEEQFYLVWPVVLVLVLRRGPRLWQVGAGLLVAAVAVSTWRWYTWVTTGDEMRTAWAPDMRADALLVGCAIGVLFVSGRLRTTRALTVSGWLVVAAVAPVVHGEWQWTWGLPLMTVASAVAVVGGVAQTSRWLSWNPLVQVGRISYGLYLWHYVLMTWFATGEGTTRLLSVLATLPVTVLIAVLSYRVLELPVMRLGPRPRPRVAVPSEA